MTDSLSPNIKKTVALLQEHGFNTTDSGDGSNYTAGMECAIPEPHVFMTVPPNFMVADALRLRDLMDQHLKIRPSCFGIEVSYSPLDGVAILMLFGVTDDLLY